MGVIAKPAHIGIVRGALAKGIIAAWAFNEGAGGVLHDYSGNGNHGTPTNGPTWTTGSPGAGLNFSALSSQYVSAPDTPSLRPTNITINALLISTSNQHYVIVNKNYNGTNVPYSLMLAEPGYGAKGIAFYPGAPRWYNSGGTDISGDGKLHLITGTYDGVNLKYYIDGELDATTAYAGVLPTANANSTDIGRYANDPIYFHGPIFNVEIWNRALSAAEIQQLYIDSFRDYRQPRRRPYLVGAGGATVWQGSAVLTGASGLSVGSETMLIANAAALTGVGSIVQGAETELIANAAALTGVASLLSDSAHLPVGAIAIIGIGSLLQGVETLLIANAAALTGVGSLIANASPSGQNAAAFAGAGSLIQGVETLLIANAATLTGVGAIVQGAETLLIANVATLSGVASFLADSAHLPLGIAAMAGEGFITTLPSHLPQGAAALTGVGSIVQGTEMLLIANASTLAGVGSLIVDATRLGQNTAALTGAGALIQGVETLLIANAATLAGEGFIVVIPIQPASLFTPQSGFLANLGRLMGRRG